MSIKKEHIIFTAILVAGFFMRALLFKSETFIGIDAVALTRLGKNLIENGVYIFGENFNWGLFFPPGYPLMVGTLNLLVDDLFISGKVISIISGVITIFLFYLTGKEIHSREAGLFAAFAYAINTSMLETSVLVETEGLFFCFLLLSIYLFMISIRRNNIFIYSMLGLSIGMSYLTRPEGILLLLLPLLSVKRYDFMKNKKQLFNICSAVIVFVLIASPYLLFIKNSTGKLSLSGKSSYLSVLLNAGVTSEEVEYDMAAYPLNEDKTHLKAFNTEIKESITDYIKKNPSEFVRGYLKNLKKASVILLKLLIPVLLPLFFSFFNKNLLKDKRIGILLLFAVVFFAVYPSFFILRRHMFPTVLFLILFSSSGFVNSGRILSEILEFYEIRKNRISSILVKNIKNIIVIILTLGSIFGFYTTAVFSKDNIPFEHVKAGQFLKNNISFEYEELNIMHRVPWVSFYSDARFTMMPYATYSEVIDFARLYNVDYIVVDERSSLKEWEYYDELIHMEKYSDHVELIYEDRSSALIKIFKVKYK